MCQVAALDEVRWAELGLDSTLAERADELDQKKYRTAAYNRKR
jgi:hypothetical protein